MSVEAARRIRGRALTILAETAWAQWAVLTSAAAPTGEKRAWTIVDPEALILASFTAGERERRLEDMAASWAHGAAELMSFHRLRALAAGYPDPVRKRVGIFARAAVDAGDKRWKRWAPEAEADAYEPRLKTIEPIRLLEGPSLTLRLRAGFGVNAKADILSLLLGFGGAAADLRVMVAASGYTERALRNAVDDMVLGGFIREIVGRPSSYYADSDAWADVLRTHRIGDAADRPVIPRWRFWGAVYAFLADVISWAEEAERAAWSEYVVGSRGHDLVDRHRRRLRQAQIEAVDLPAASEPGPLAVLERLVEEIQVWANDGLYPAG